MTAERPTILFYGNCQAGALAVVFNAHPVLREHFLIRHLPSFDDPATPRDLTPAEAASAVALFEQHDPTPFPLREYLPADCPTVTFPSVDFHLLWPLSRDNPYNERTAELPWGRFPYGDRAIMVDIEAGLSADEILTRRLASPPQLPDLDRFYELERGRLQARDSKCEVKFGSFLFERFRDADLFWCVNHPTVAALHELSARLIAALGTSSPLGNVRIDEVRDGLPPVEPLALIRVPVEPVIAHHFGLRWYNPSDVNYGLHGAGLTADRYLEDLVRSAVAVRDRQRAETPAV